MGQIYLGEEELKVRRIGHDAMMEEDVVHIGYEADVTAHLARHQRNENRSHRASGHRSGSECDADKNSETNGFHERISNSDESQTGRRQSRGNLCGRKNTDNGPPHGRTGPLDELPGGREFERRRPIHLRQRFCQEF